MEEEKSGLQPAVEDVPAATGNTAGNGVNAAPAASAPESDGTEPSPASREEFESLITGRYKDAYKARVSAIVKDRLKSAKESEKKLDRLAPVISALAEKYSVSADDTDGLLRAVGNDSAKADTAEQKDAEGGAEKTEAPPAAVEEVYSGWLGQAQSAKERFPSLDLREELSNPEFRALLLGGADVEKAYLALHADEILPAVMRYAVREAGRKMAGRLADNDARAPENGALSRGAVLPVSDVSQLTKSQRQEIIKRVARGETIRF